MIDDSVSFSRTLVDVVRFLYAFREFASEWFQNSTKRTSRHPSSSTLNSPLRILAVNHHDDFRRLHNNDTKVTDKTAREHRLGLLRRSTCREAHKSTTAAGKNPHTRHNFKQTIKPSNHPAERKLHQQQPASRLVRRGAPQHNNRHDV